MSAVATAIVGGAVVGGAASYFGSQSAANTQANADLTSISAQESMFNTLNQQNQPWIQAGSNALGQIQNNMASYNTPFNPSIQQLENTPGYQFQLNQGLGAIQNSAAAQGHLVSSNELGAANSYAQNLASTSYQQAFNNYQTQISNSYNRLASLAGLGQAANSTMAQAGGNTANGVSSAIQGAGAAQAAGTMGMANAISGGIGQGVNSYMGYQSLNALNNMSMGNTTDPAVNDMNSWIYS